MTEIRLNTIPEGLKPSKRKMVVVVDDEDRENEGDLITSSELITPEKSILWRSMAGSDLCGIDRKAVRRAGVTHDGRTEHFLS